MDAFKGVFEDAVAALEQMKKEGMSVDDMFKCHYCDNKIIFPTPKEEDTSDSDQQG